MISEVSNELFTMCEDATEEILNPFYESMRQSTNEDETIEKMVSGLSFSQRFAISCFIMEMSGHVDLEENVLPNDKELQDWFRNQWECVRQN